jgi:hypothetical protein
LLTNYKDVLAHLPLFFFVFFTVGHDYACQHYKVYVTAAFIQLLLLWMFSTSKHSAILETVPRDFQHSPFLK